MEPAGWDVRDVRREGEEAEAGMEGTTVDGVGGTPIHGGREEDRGVAEGQGEAERGQADIIPGLGDRLMVYSVLEGD